MIPQEKNKLTKLNDPIIYGQETALSKAVNYNTKCHKPADSEVTFIFNKHDEVLSVNFARIAQSGRRIEGQVSFTKDESLQIAKAITQATVNQ